MKTRKLVATLLTSNTVKMYSVNCHWGYEAGTVALSGYIN